MPRAWCMPGAGCNSLPVIGTEAGTVSVHEAKKNDKLNVIFRPHHNNLHVNWLYVQLFSQLIDKIDNSI